MTKSLFTRLRLWAAPALAALSLVAAVVSSGLSLGPPVARTAMLVGAGVLATQNAEATLTLSTASRTDMMTALMGRLANGRIAVYAGTKPAALDAPSGTRCAQLNLGSPAGTVSAGVFTVGAVTQTNSSHVSCTPTFIRFENSSGVAEADIDIGSGAGNVQFTGTVTNGQNVTVTGLTLTAPNA